MSSATSPSFFNRKHTSQGFVILGTVFGFFAMIWVVPDLLGGIELRAADFAWSALALVCWFFASFTLGRLGPGVGSALAAAFLGSSFLSSGFIMAGRGGIGFALGFGAAAVALAVILGVFRRFWGAV